MDFINTVNLTAVMSVISVGSSDGVVKSNGHWGQADCPLKQIPF